MEIREGRNCIEIETVDRVPTDLPSAGDVELSVAVSSETFRGQGFAWIAASALASFLNTLRDLEARRQGEAVLDGLSPGEFRRRIWSVDRQGHITIGGLLTKQVYQGEGNPYRHAVEFGFAFDPTLLPKRLFGFQAIVDTRD